jgi:hypothetical protein
VPQALRVQIIQILFDAVGEPGEYKDEVNSFYDAVHDALAREYGVFRLGDNSYKSNAGIGFFLDGASVEQAFDFIDLSFVILYEQVDRPYNFSPYSKVHPKDAISELNIRFREHGVGYQFESGELIRVDSQLVHAEIVKPALELLRDTEYSGANAEYLRAFEHYRHGRFEECLADCLKAFESAMKAICERRRWTYEQTDTAKKLLDILFSKGLIQPYAQSEFTAVRSALESGVPTVRNKEGGHGRGVQPRSVPRHLAEFLLHLTAANILFLANAEAALR